MFNSDNCNLYLFLFNSLTWIYPGLFSNLLLIHIQCNGRMGNYWAEVSAALVALQTDLKSMIWDFVWFQRMHRQEASIMKYTMWCDSIFVQMDQMSNNRLLGSIILIIFEQIFSHFPRNLQFFQPRPFLTKLDLP